MRFVQMWKHTRSKWLVYDRDTCIAYVVRLSPNEQYVEHGERMRWRAFDGPRVFDVATLRAVPMRYRQIRGY